jgi:Xaa-Pro aminopeptidase
MNRRNFLATTGMVGAAAVGHAVPAPTISAVTEDTAPPAKLGTLFNRERATDIMHRADLAGLAVTSALNVYYTTNAIPVLSRFSQINTAVAIIPANPALPIAYITDGFEYYAGVSDSGVAEGVVPYLVGGSFTVADPRHSPAFDVAGNYAFDAREQHRRALLNKAAPFHESLQKACAKALADLGMTRAPVGADCADARELIRQTAPRATVRDASDLMLHIRLVKTEAELQLMRRAADNNVQASLAAIQGAREEGSVFRLRQRFFREAAQRGNLGVYGSIDLVMSELGDGTFRDGQGVMIDFVSHYGFYQGDFGRTVFYGEPDARIARAAQVGAQAWKEIRSRLKPGLKFSDIPGIGNAVVHQLGERFDYAFHSVGLQHWDHPRFDLNGAATDITLEPGMVLSVDCPLLNAGVNGTTHIEDLVVITTQGADLIHRPAADTYQV